MNQPGMRVTVEAAMRARDVSRPRSDDDQPESSPPKDAKNGPTPTPTANPTAKERKGEKRRMAKRRRA